MKSQQEMIDLLKEGNPQHYKKSGIYDYIVFSDESGEIVTSINGEKEVKNIAHKGDYILTGLAGEQYIIKPETFAKRYEVVTSGKKSYQFDNIEVVGGVAKAKGECWGIVYDGDNTVFVSPWNNEPMTINNGDMLVSPNPHFTEAYRIEIGEFKKTYSPAPSPTLV